MTKQELFEIDVGINETFNTVNMSFLWVSKYILHCFYDHYNEDIFSRYNIQTIKRFIEILSINYVQPLLAFTNWVDLNLEILKLIKNLFEKNNLFIIKKFLDYYEFYENNSLLCSNLYINFNHIVTNIFNPCKDLYREWLEDKDLSYDKFIDDLNVLYRHYKTYYFIDKACKIANCSLKQLAEMIRKKEISKYD